jgi:hypothetical protein
MPHILLIDDGPVHPGVREQQVGGRRHERERRHDGVRLRLEELEKRRAGFGGSHEN